MKQWKLEDLEKVSGKNGITVQKVKHSFSTQTVHLTFKEGAILPLHTTPADVLFYIIKGTGTVTIGDEIKELETGTYIESPKDIPHGWENSGTKELKVLVIKLF